MGALEQDKIGWETTDENCSNSADQENVSIVFSRIRASSLISLVTQNYYGETENLQRRLDRLLEADEAKPLAFRRALVT